MPRVTQQPFAAVSCRASSLRTAGAVHCTSVAGLELPVHMPTVMQQPALAAIVAAAGLSTAGNWHTTSACASVLPMHIPSVMQHWLRVRPWSVSALGRRWAGAAHLTSGSCSFCVLLTHSPAPSTSDELIRAAQALCQLTTAHSGALHEQSQCRPTLRQALYKQFTQNNQSPGEWQIHVWLTCSNAAAGLIATSDQCCRG